MYRILNGMLGMMCVAAMLALTSATQAAPITVIQDNFNRNNQGWSNNVIGYAPDTTNLPGGVWVKTAGYTTFNPQQANNGWGGLPSSALIMGTGGVGGGNTNVGVAVALTGYKPTSISADIRQLWGNSGSLAIGFYTATVPSANTGGVGAMTGFTGILATRAGVLTLYENGVAGTQVTTSISTSWTTKTLSYDINTAAGTISNIVFGGTAISGLSSTAFTSSATVYAAAVAVSTDAQTTMDNFKVMGVEIPEPASIALFTVGLSTLLLRRRSDLR